ncbi:hypothetical protein [Pyrodictium delaneyi]|uniref:Uncharacterized protein n=1 Tax=Pyrodictium delaneyi TaxID=1273541 RepID=A0A211YNJ4_9CREN|nr:hypothetical protein [Pyrodictium delaneyi]OWJ54622.1 hypothetical protein Pdsh_06265 [Pyrodictium delaneyi]
MKRAREALEASIAVNHDANLVLNGLTRFRLYDQPEEVAARKRELEGAVVPMLLTQWKLDGYVDLGATAVGMGVYRDRDNGGGEKY